MTQYDKLTVVEIRAEFKARGIPATGLTRKQQLIDRLFEVDAEKKAATSAEDTVATAGQDISAQDNVEDAEEAIEQAHAPLVPSEEEHNVQPVVNNEIVPDEAGNGHKETQAANISAPSAEDAGQPQEYAGHIGTDAPTTATDVAQTIEESNQQLGEPIEISSSEPSKVELGDNRKRKRRGLTPEMQAEEVVQKRRRPSESVDEFVPRSLGDGSSRSNAQGAEIKMHVQAEETDIKSTVAESQGEEDQPRMGDEASDLPSATKEPHSGSPKDVLPTDGPSPPMPALGGTNDDSSNERYVTPSLHPATAALYIRNLKRPLQPQALESHLETLARHPAHTSDTAPIIAFHLDTLRTHALIIFTSVAAAARVRAALHQSIWPSEPTREPLWVDFVPEESVEDWIDLERKSGDGGRGAGAKRWEVVYEDGWARFQEVSGSIQPPSGPRASFVRQSAPPPKIPTPEVQHVAEAAKPAPFLALDNLFKSTVAKPKLYFLPVAADLADKRLDEFDSRTTRRGEIPPGGSGYRDSRRYTFEDGGLVDGGPEFGLRVERGGPGGRGGRGGRGGGRRGR